MLYGCLSRFVLRGAGIPDGRFCLQGKEYSLPPNAGPTALHGGADGLYTRVFMVSSLSESDDSVTAEFTYVSPANEAGYPGELSVKFTCSLNDANELRMEYGATTNEPTIVSLTNHSYWNLNGHGGNSVMDQELVLYLLRRKCLAVEAAIMLEHRSGWISHLLLSIEW